MTLRTVPTMTLLKVCSLLFMVALFSVRFLASNKDVQKNSEHCGEGSAPFTYTTRIFLANLLWLMAYSGDY